MDKSASMKIGVKTRMVQKLAKVKGKIVAGAGVIAGVSLVVLPASANSTVDWTSLTEIINGATGIFPAIGSMVVGIVPTLMVLAVVGFIMYFFDAILDAVRGATSFFKR